MRATVIYIIMLFLTGCQLEGDTGDTAPVYGQSSSRSVEVGWRPVSVGSLP
jgi:hypothetical protein